MRLVNDEKQTLIFTLHCYIDADEVHFDSLFDFDCVLLLKCLQNHTSCGEGRSISPELEIKASMPILKKEPSRDRDIQVRNFVLAVRGADGGFQHRGQRQLHLHPPATRGDMTPTLCVFPCTFSLTYQCFLTKGKCKYKWAHTPQIHIYNSGWHFSGLGNNSNPSNVEFSILYTISPVDL